MLAQVRERVEAATDEGSQPSISAEEESGEGSAWRVEMIYRPVDLAITDEMKKDFWSQVDYQKRSYEECWLWRGNTSLHKGWGVAEIEGEGAFWAHRLAYTFSKGRIPDDSFVVHTCLNGLCCNPEHLYASKEINPIERLQVVTPSSGTDKQAGQKFKTDMFRLYSAGITNISQLAKRAGCTHDTAHRVISGRSWAKMEPWGPHPDYIAQKTQGEASEEKKRLLFSLYGQGKTLKECGAAMGVCWKSVKLIISGEKWADILPIGAYEGKRPTRTEASEEKKLKVYELREAGMSFSEIAVQMGMSKGSAQGILNGWRWKETEPREKFSVWKRERELNPRLREMNPS